VILNQLFETETEQQIKGNIGSTAFAKFSILILPLRRTKAIVEKVNALLVYVMHCGK
jgi:hypothetical protein